MQADPGNISTLMEKEESETKPQEDGGAGGAREALAQRAPGWDWERAGDGFVEGAGLGAIAGAEVGAALGAPGGPVSAGAGAARGAAIGAVTGGVIGAIAKGLTGRRRGRTHDGDDA
jgi:hypothetical protein